MGQNGALSPKQKRAITALLTTNTVTEAAKTAGVSRNTVTRWLSDPMFKAELDRTEAQYVSESLRGLIQACSTAVTLLRDVMADPDATTSARVRAALGVLDGLLRMREHISFDERIKRLEERDNERTR